ncbi:hypothetical protein BHE74_00015567, partial [Ensete ventricosum]
DLSICTYLSAKCNKSWILELRYWLLYIHTIHVFRCNVRRGFSIDDYFVYVVTYNLISYLLIEKDDSYLSNHPKPFYLNCWTYFCSSLVCQCLVSFAQSPKGNTSM